MFTSPAQIAFSIGSFKVYYYGLIMAASIAVGVLCADIIASKKYGLKKETIVDMSPYIIVLGLIFARLYYCLMDFDFYMRFPTEILALRHGGISIHGAILGGLIGILVYAKRKKLDFFKLLDISAIGLALGQAIGRWGNFFNSEAYGLPTSLPWKLYVAPQYRQIPYLDFEFYHPTFLYESLCDFCIFVILLFIVNKNIVKKDGNLALIYLILYSIIRIFIESLRIDSVRYIYGLPVAIIVSVGIIVVSSLVLFIRNKEKV